MDRDPLTEKVAQILSYMKLASIRTGLLLNFNVELLKDEITWFKL